MRNTIITIISILIVSAYALAGEQVRDFKAYKKVRAEAKSAFEAGDYMKAYELYLKAAETTPYKWVEAYQLNNAALAFIKADKKDLNGNISKETAKKALELLEKALPLAEVGIDLSKWEPATSVIKRNMLYCKRVLGLEPWPKN